MSENESLLVKTKKYLKEHELYARKGLGQHFLVDDGVLKQILDTAELSQDDVVMEVGSGLGVLTEELVKRAGRVIAIELDLNLARLLKQNLCEYKTLFVVNEDVLETEPAVLLTFVGGQHYKVVANLPYYITSAVMRHFLEATVKPVSMVVMVQEEVARQITAQPGEMSLLAVSVQLYGEPRIVAKVPASAFYPAPNVGSAILKVDVFPEMPLPASDIEGFFKIVKAGFSANRKQLLNSFSHGLGIEKQAALVLLDKSGIDPKRRAETLTIEEWKRLYGCFKESK
ncbi:MAG TPA: 16S rRNA (adenine(1518)-N(6)/adenine(1519)-N(6))-dimethyltransferase RsmA [Dehalococcoidales bacterium]|nr:16S rRNA (adenine(1518)-N(6)/adenine(1519)-N(6))-dimethyltransferase RsmA [Dehalococcoidales bacterium]